MKAWRIVPSSVGGRVALAVNLLVAVAAIGFLAFDYHRESHQRLADKAASLREQAMTFHQAVAGYKGESADRQQRFIDAVCGRMDDADSPGHHLIVEIDGRVLQSQAHRRASDELLAAVRAAADAEHPEDAELIVGRHSEAAVTVYVAERMSQVRAEIRRQVVVRSAGVLTFCVFLALAVNAVLRKVVQKPLRRLVRTIDGIAAGNYGTSAGYYSAAELARLADAVDAMSRALAEAEGRRKAATDKARRIQHHLLPANGRLPGLEIGVFYLAADDVAGDYYDLFRMPDGTTVVCVADVVGHGVPAAMIAAMLKVLLAEAATAHDDPGEMLGWVNRRLTAVTLPEDFATVFLARWNPVAGRLRYASAGHEPALFVPEGGPAVALDSTGTLLGIDAVSTWETGELSVKPCDLLVCWTDGLSEARDVAGGMFGRERVAALIEQHRTGTAGEITERVRAAVLGYAGGGTVSDDCTFLAIRFEASAADDHRNSESTAQVGPAGA